ncbi:MAG: hypothetical protein JWM10_4231 [Myxococcaceae bacterium]|nr:hypothetical protein [Myxococcaceae bacterium]
MTQRPLLALALGLALPLLACRNAPPEPPAPPAASRIAPAIPMPTAAAPHDGTLRWTDPAAWRRGTPPPGSMRRGQYEVPGPDGAGELTVFWFGAGQGGSIDANLARWYGQFTQPDGRPSSAVATRERRTSHGLAVTVTRVEGRFAGGGMAAPGADPSTPRDHYALLGAIVETPNGPWFFKLTGPRATLAAATPAFDEMVASFDFR